MNKNLISLLRNYLEAWLIKGNYNYRKIIGDGAIKFRISLTETEFIIFITNDSVNYDFSNEGINNAVTFKVNSMDIYKFNEVNYILSRIHDALYSELSNFSYSVDIQADDSTRLEFINKAKQLINTYDKNCDLIDVNNESLYSRVTIYQPNPEVVSALHQWIKLFSSDYKTHERLSRLS